MKLSLRLAIFTMAVMTGCKSAQTSSVAADETPVAAATSPASSGMDATFPAVADQDAKSIQQAYEAGRFASQIADLKAGLAGNGSEPSLGLGEEQGGRLRCASYGVSGGLIYSYHKWEICKFTDGDWSHKATIRSLGITAAIGEGSVDMWIYCGSGDPVGTYVGLNAGADLGFGGKVALFGNTSRVCAVGGFDLARVGIDVSLAMLWLTEM
jgi:hypothetical protein